VKDLCIDLGCGGKKKPGTIGVDMADAPGVDHVVDFEKEPLPFPDQSVRYIHLSHCMEHIRQPEALFREITRVAQDGARLDMWGPYAWENSAFIFDHRNFFNEDHFYHPCVWFPDFWRDIFGARWLLHGFTYVVPEPILRELRGQGITMAFAIRYFKGVVKEFCAHVEVSRDAKPVEPAVRRMLALDRNGPRHEIRWEPGARWNQFRPVRRVLRGLGTRPVQDALDGMPPDLPRSGASS